MKPEARLAFINRFWEGSRRAVVSGCFVGLMGVGMLSAQTPDSSAIGARTQTIERRVDTNKTRLAPTAVAGEAIAYEQLIITSGGYGQFWSQDSLGNKDVPTQRRALSILGNLEILYNDGRSETTLTAIVLPGQLYVHDYSDYPKVDFRAVAWSEVQAFRIQGTGYSIHLDTTRSDTLQVRIQKDNPAGAGLDYAIVRAGRVESGYGPGEAQMVVPTGADTAGRLRQTRERAYPMLYEERTSTQIDIPRE